MMDLRSRVSRPLSRHLLLLLHNTLPNLSVEPRLSVLLSAGRPAGGREERRAGAAGPGQSGDARAAVPGECGGRSEENAN